MADDLTSLADEVGEIQKSFDGITAAIHKASETTEGWGYHLKELSSAQKASGQLWLVFGRLLSGSGLWRFQNRIKAISNFLKFQDKMTAKRMEREKEIVARMAEQTKLLLDVEKSLKVFEDIEGDIVTHKQMQALYDSEHMKYLMEVHGRKKAEEMMEERLLGAQKNIGKMRKESLGVRIEEHKQLLDTQNIENAGWKAVVLRSDAQKEFLSLTERQQGVYLEMKTSLEDLEILNERWMIADKERMEIVREINRLEAIGRGTRSDAENRELDKLVKDKKQIEEDIADINRRGQKATELSAEHAATLKSENVTMDADGELIDNVQGLADAFGEAWDNYKNEVQSRKGWFKRTRALMSMGGKLNVKDVKEKTGGGMSEKLGELLQKLPDIPVISNVATMIGKSLGSSDEAKKYRAKLKENAIKSVRLIGKMFMIVPLLLLALTMLKDAGVIDWMAGVLDAFRWLGSRIAETITALKESLGEAWLAAQTFFGILFGGQEGSAWTAFGKMIVPILESMFYILLLGLELTLGTVLAVFGGLFWGMLKAELAKYGEEGKGRVASLMAVLAKGILIWKSIQFALWLPVPPWAKFIAGIFMYWIGGKLIDVLVKGFDEMLKKLGKRTSGFLVGGLAGAATGGLMGAKYGFAGGGVAGATVGLVAGGIIGGIAGSLAEGGPVNRTGRYLVGERGPEIVNLPAGSSVTPNHKMGNTINVHVNGRLGASDTELRDIAQKVGRMVNMELNRNTSSSLRGA